MSEMQTSTWIQRAHQRVRHGVVNDIMAACEAPDAIQQTAESFIELGVLNVLAE